jgi:hypothetical protein
MKTSAEILRDDLGRARRTQSQIEARRHDLAHPAPSVSDLAEIAERYHDAYSSVGAPGAPAPLPNESRFSYRRRLAAGLQRFSPEWRAADLYRVGVDVMKAAEPAILAATAAAVADRTRPDPARAGCARSSPSPPPVTASPILPVRPSPGCATSCSPPGPCGAS